MSEYQYIAFRATDSPVSEKNLAYMRRQSTRAEITPWSFDNEYHFGDFRGNAEEMLRRGYDVHMHYANYGIRTLLVRLPHGFPDGKSAKHYLDGESVRFLKDKKGRGGILSISPYFESGELDPLWDLDDLTDRLVPLCSEILDGDLRPLYLAHLAVGCDDDHDPEETAEAPVPAGLGELSDAQRALAELYQISDSLIEAAKQGSPSLPRQQDRQAELKSWLAAQSQATKDEWLVGLLDDPSSSPRSEILARFRDASGRPHWPTVDLKRTIAQLWSAADDIQQKKKAKAAAKAARQRAAKLKKMAADPSPYLKKTEQLVAERSTAAYGKASKLLAELREAIADTKQAGLAEKQALKLKTKNPTRHHLAAALKREGFLSK